MNDSTRRRSTPPQRQHGGRVGLVVASALIATSLGAYPWLTGRAGTFADPDGYTRLVRARHLIETGDWFATRLPNSNPIRPETIQWCRWIDFAIAVGGTVIGTLGAEDGLFLFGELWSPIWGLALALVLGLSAGMKPLAWVSQEMRWLAVIVWIAQPFMAGFFAGGRPDHHAVLLFLMGANIALVLKALAHLVDRAAGPRLLGWAAWAGLGHGIALGVSIEAALPIMLAYAVFSARWILSPASRPPLAFTSGLFCGAAVMFVSQVAPSQWTVFELDRLNLIYMLGLGCALLGHAICFSLARHLTTTTSKAVCAAVIAGASLGVMALTNPLVLFGPMANLEPFVREHWYSRVNELQPLFQNIRTALPMAVGTLMPIAVGVGALLRLRSLRQPHWWAWLYMLAGLVLFTVVGCYQIRWIAYAGVFNVVPSTVGLIAFAAWLHSRAPRLPVTTIRPLLTVAYLALPPLALVAAQDEGAGAAVTHANDMQTSLQDLRALGSWLDQQDGTERIMAPPRFGPPLLYFSRSEVIATPNHRNGDGMRAAVECFGTTDDAQAKQILANYGVTHVLITGQGGEDGMFAATEPARRQDSTVYQRLVRGSPIAYLPELEIPEGLALKLFEFQGSPSPNR